MNFDGRWGDYSSEMTAVGGCCLTPLKLQRSGEKFNSRNDECRGELNPSERTAVGGKFNSLKLLLFNPP
jgi:hypothetical protein